MGFCEASAKRVGSRHEIRGTPLLNRLLCPVAPQALAEWERTYASLTPAQYIFLILQDDLHYDDDTIAQMLAVKPASLRTLRSRIKGREK